MKTFSKRVLFWTPRVLSIAFIAFLSIFALDVFDGKLGFWQSILAFLIHEIPVFVLIAVLVLAWRWEWIGAALYAAAGSLYIAWVLTAVHGPFDRMPAAARVIAILGIAGPAFVIAGLFLANWLKRGELRAPER